MSHQPTPPREASIHSAVKWSLTRREWLAGSVSAAALVAAAGSTPLTPRVAFGQAPKGGGTLTLRLWDPPHWDPYLIIAFKTQIPYTFTHSRLLKHRAGPAIQPGTFPLEVTWPNPGASLMKRPTSSSCAAACDFIRNRR
jgi:hypothetical protein